MPKVLVTGYGGFLGATITRQLLLEGYEVRGLARGRYPELEQAGVESIQGDVADRQTVLQYVAGCEAIVHTAAKAGVWGRWNDYYRINTLATSHLLEAAHTSRVRAFVHTSSPSVTFAGQPQTGVDESEDYPKRWLCHYPHTKALAEQAVLAAAQAGGIFACALRPHLIWGAGDPHLFPRVVVRARQGRLRRVGSGQNLIDIVHVQHAAQAHVQALTQLLQGDSQLNGQALFLSDGQPVACWEWITQILETAGVAVPRGTISFKSAYRIGALLEGLYTVGRIRQEPPMTRFVAAQLALDHYFNIERARQLLGYQPHLDRTCELQRCRPWLQAV